MSLYVNTSSTFALGIVFPVLCTASVALRLVARKNVGLRYGADDWMAVAALVLTLGCSAIMIYGAATAAIGWTPPPGDELPPTTTPAPAQAELYVLTEKLKYALLLLSILAIGFIRLTFILLYSRIFQYKHFETVGRIMIAIITAWTTAFFFAILFTCGTHFSANWGSTEDLVTYCHGQDEFVLDNAMVASDVVLDIIILLLPIVPTCQLQMSAWRKCLVLVVFALGTFSVAAGLTRTVLTVQLTHFKYGSLEKVFGIPAMADPTGVVSVTLWWTYLEIGLGCLVSNLPPTMGLVRGRVNNLIGAIRSKILNPVSRHSSTAHLDVEQQMKDSKPKARAWSSVQLSEISSQGSI